MAERNGGIEERELDRFRVEIENSKANTKISQKIRRFFVRGKRTVSGRTETYALNTINRFRFQWRSKITI